MPLSKSIKLALKTAANAERETQISSPVTMVTTSASVVGSRNRCLGYPGVLDRQRSRFDGSALVCGEVCDDEVCVVYEETWPAVG